MQLREDKYVRIFHANTNDINSELERLHEKGVQFLYMRHEDYLKMTSDFMQKIREKINVKKAHHKSLNFLAKFGHASVCRLVSEFGLKKEVLNIAGSSLKLIQTVVAKRTKLADLVKGIIEGKDYRSEHTLLLVYIR